MTESKKILTAIPAVVLLIGMGLQDASASWIKDAVNAIQEPIDEVSRHLTDWTRINVKVHNHADHPVLVRVFGESQIVAPKATFIFRNAGPIDWVTVDYINHVTGEAFYSDDLGLPLGHKSSAFGG